MNQDFQAYKGSKLDFASTLTTEHEAEMEKHTQFDKDTVVAFNDKISTNYDSIMDKVGYPDPALVEK